MEAVAAQVGHPVCMSNTGSFERAVDIEREAALYFFERVSE